MKEFLEKTIWEAGKRALEIFHRDFEIREKGEDTLDLLTEADTTVHTFITERITKAYPDHKITSEEGENNVSTYEYEWIIDPIDGTYSFAHQSPLWGIVMSVLKDDMPVYSGILFPASNQFFFADDSGAYLNNKRLHVSDKKELQGSVGAFLSSKPFGPYGVLSEIFIKAKKNFIDQYAKKDFACFSPMDYMFVATKMCDFMVSNAGMVWDKLPQKHICEMAGAVVTDSEGNPWKRGRQDIIISATKELHTEVLALFE